MCWCVIVQDLLIFPTGVNELRLSVLLGSAGLGAAGKTPRPLLRWMQKIKNKSPIKSEKFATIPFFVVCILLEARQLTALSDTNVCLCVCVNLREKEREVACIPVKGHQKPVENILYIAIFSLAGTPHLSHISLLWERVERWLDLIMCESTCSVITISVL